MTFSYARFSDAGCVPDSPVELIPRTSLRCIVIPLAADALAADEKTVYEVPLPFGLLVLKVSIMPQGALTADDTDYATLTLNQAATALATWVTKITGGTGDWVAGTAVDPTTTPSAVIAPGAVLSLVSTKASSGVALPDLRVGLWCVERRI